MKAVWLTQEQVDEAWHQVLENQQVRLVNTVNVGFSGIDRSELSLTDYKPVLKRKYKQIALMFERTRFKAGWRLITPVQIVDEWLARQMQTVDE